MALREAEQSRKNGNWAVGCVITLEGKPVAKGRNFVYSKQNRLLHAEIDAIAKLQEAHFDSKGKDFVLYTTLEPCPMCMGAIMLAGIRRIVAGTNIDHSGASAQMDHLPAFFQQPHFKTTLTTGVLSKECSEMWLSGIPAQGIVKRDVVIDNVNSRKVRVYVSPIRDGQEPLRQSHKGKFRTVRHNYLASLKYILTNR